MKVFASSFNAWKMLEENNDIKVPHGLVFPLAVVEAIGAPYGLEMTAEEHATHPPIDYDAIFISILDSRCMIEGGKHFNAWGIPIRRQDREKGRYPLVWAGGQGLHNPLPMADIFDLCVIGDAEEPLPKLLLAWDSMGGDRYKFLRYAATISGVYVPSIHDPKEDRVEQSVANDISITLNNEIQVSHNGQRRVEIARGCKYKCGFCSLGWRAPVRENTADDVIQVIEASPKLVHLQAGDAESHSGIRSIREALVRHGGRDNGWTGRLDTTLENPDVEIPGTKRYAFGVEGVSERLRVAVGKGYLTNDRLARDTVQFLSNIEKDYYGRTAWHLISGLPTERGNEILELRKVILSINDSMKSSKRRNLALHWQPFQPLAGTPMQWFGCGGGVRAKAAALKDLGGLPMLRVTQLTGRTDYMAAATTILSRATPRGGASILEAMASQVRPTIEALREMGEAHEKELNPEEPLPWDFISYAYSKETMRRAYDTICRKLTGIDAGEWRSFDVGAQQYALTQALKKDDGAPDLKGVKEYGIELAAMNLQALIKKKNNIK